MTRLRAALNAGVAHLAAAGIDGHIRDARLLFAAVIGVPSDRLTLEPDRALTPDEITQFQNFIDRRSAHEPVSRILSRRLFWGRSFQVTPDTLDPRPETEILIAAALELGPQPNVLDLGTGTGIIAVTLLAEWPNATAVLTDVDRACLVVATKNAAAQGVAARATCRVSDWFQEVCGQFSLIVSNPPYIAADEMAALSPEVAGHDPHLALTDQLDGLSAYRHIANGVLHHLDPGGVIMVEIGPTQGPDVAALFIASGLIEPEIRQDFDGRDRVVMARAPG